MVTDSARNKYVFVINLTLLTGLLTSIDFGSIRAWVQVAGLFSGYVYLTRSIEFGDAKYAVWPMVWRVLLSVAVLLVWLYLSRITAIYLIGCFYLATIFSSWLIQPLHRRDMTTQTWVTGVLVAIVLAASPITISRIVINLNHLAVPSKFQLHSSDGATRSHHASRGYPTHHLNPLSVRLSADNLALNEPMPWLEFQARRDTLFPIAGIQYDFLQATVYRLNADELHQIDLSDRSDDVTLEKLPHGITISDIGAGESAWIKLPDLHLVETSRVTLAKVLMMKLLIWVLICTAFWRWNPMALRKS